MKFIPQNDQLSTYLTPLGLSDWRFYPEVGSTNDIALEWVRQGAPDWALVVADAQTAGRGRDGRRWVTEPGHSLAFSLALRLSPAETRHCSRLAALAALGLIGALSGMGLKATLKWPNDVLLSRRKVAGVLVEVSWQSDQVEAAVIGMGVNVSPQSVPSPGAVRYPATCVETILGARVDRWALLANTLRAMQDTRAILGEDAFIDAWNDHLAMRGELVGFQMRNEEPRLVRVIGVNSDGQLAMETQDGRQIDAPAGEILWEKA